MEQLNETFPAELCEVLINANIKSPRTIFKYTKTELAYLTKLDLNCIEEIYKKCAEIVLKGKITPAKDLKSWQRLSTGCSNIDNILKGGVPINGIIEISGCSGVGKTQFCLQLALMAQLPVQLSGLEKSVVYICTEDVFPVKRLKELSNIFSIKYNTFSQIFEDNIFIEHVADGEQLKRCLFKKLPKLLNVKNIGLVVIDSIAGAFRSENINYIDRSQDFLSIAVNLHKLSDKHNFATICTNQVADNIVTGTTEPCLGLAWSNKITCRLQITRLINSKVRDIEVVFAPDLQSNKTKFIIAREGLISFGT